MISFFARNITNALFKARILDTSERELYEYGFFILLSHIFFFLITVLLGFVLGTIWESIIFYLTFSLLRGYAGGYHAKTENKCAVFTVISLFLCGYGIYILNKLDNNIFPIFVVGINSLLIFKMCPQDSDNKPIDATELDFYRKKSYQIIFGILILALFFSLLGYNGFLYAATLSLSLESCLLILGKMRKQSKP